MNEEQLLKDYRDREQGRAITKVSDRLYHFTGIGHSNAIAIIGDTSVILIDALDCVGYAEELKSEIAKITDKPVKTIIFTHGHPDHRGGSGAFRDTVEEIIAFAPRTPMLAHYDKLADIQRKRGAYQFGLRLSEEDLITQGLGKIEGIARGMKMDFLQPTTLYKDEWEVNRTIDGVELKLVRAPGETDDQIFVWLEEEGAMCCGDNYYACWPNLYAIRGVQYRDVSSWVESLTTMASYPSKVLLPGHMQVIWGEDEIREHLTTYRDAIEHVLMATLDCMNQGMTIEETAEAVRLPKELAEKEYLGEFYGTVSIAVRAIYVGYLGWFDGNATQLLPAPEAEYKAAMLELIGEERLLEKVRAYIAEENFQMALQLLEFADAPDLKKQALLGRAKQTTSSNARHYLICAANEI